MRRRDIRIICFDLGGVVVRVCSSWELVCRRAGVALRPEMFTDDRMSALRKLDEQHQLGRIEIRQYHRRFGEVLGGLYDETESALIHDAWLLGEHAGMRELVEELHALGLRTGCLSNTNARHWEMMTANHVSSDGSVADPFPAFRMLQVRVASHELGLAKPDPAIYRRFEAAAGVRPEEILFFDDLAVNVEGARSLGWNADLVPADEPPAAFLRERLIRAGILRPGSESRSVTFGP